MRGRWGTLGAVILPMGAGYFLSYFFRNVMGPIGGDLVAETGLDAASLGLLTGAYFAAFTLSQIPLGIALDSHGPRRVQAGLLVVAALGALVFSLSQSAAGLTTGRFLIGLGTAGCLTAGLKATMHWSGPGANLSTINGVFVMFGGVGAMAATYPLARLSAALGWRTTFDVLAAAAALLAVATWILVPELPAGVGSAAGRKAATLRGHPSNPRFWTMAPVSALTFGVVSAFLGLWTSRWLADVAHLDPDQIVTRLLIMAGVMAIGAPFLGVLASTLRRRVSIAGLLLAVGGLLVVTEGLICLGTPLPDFVLWPVLALFGSIPVLSYGVVAELYPSTLIGRANAVLNMLHTGTAFTAQFVIGAIINLWPGPGGVYPAVAYHRAMLAMMVIQTVAIVVYAVHRWRGTRIKDQRIPLAADVACIDGS